MSLTRRRLKVTFAGAAWRLLRSPRQHRDGKGPPPRPRPKRRRETLAMPALPFGCHATLCGRQNAAPKAPPQAFAKRIAASRSRSGWRMHPSRRKARARLSPLAGRGFGLRPNERSEAKRGLGGGAERGALPAPQRLFVTAPSPSPAAQACRLRRPSPRKRGEAKGRRAQMTGKPIRSASPCSPARRA